MSEMQNETTSIKNNDLQYPIDTVLVNQGGGSLGVYECGVAKVLVNHGIDFDIVGGASIGSINATILVANYSTRYGFRNSIQKLENFWMDVGEKMFMDPFCSEQQRTQISAFNSIVWGNPKAFTPLWIERGGLPFYYFFSSPYLYNLDKLKNTINNYVDFNKLRKIPEKQQTKEEYDSAEGQIERSNSNKIPRLIITATNIQSGGPVTFDSYKTDITIDHLMASIGYAIYGLPWTKINNDYLWDGSLVHNSPLETVIKSAPNTVKIAYVSDVFPLKQKELPTNMPQTYHRVRDLIFHDISIRQATEISDIIKEDFSLLQQMREVLLESKDKNEKTKRKLEKIENEYNNILSKRKGKVMKNVIHIQRKEGRSQHLFFEDADFSISAIERLIREGEKDAEEVLLKNQ